MKLDEIQTEHNQNVMAKILAQRKIEINPNTLFSVLHQKKMYCYVYTLILETNMQLSFITSKKKNFRTFETENKNFINVYIKIDGFFDMI